MWGSITTIDNYTGLASFFGQVDIHTYSYAWAGAYKVIDERLYGSIPEADLRKAWFNKDKRLVPDWKFYDLNRGETEATIDRNWLNDLVFMRVEEMYLIAAEAAERNGNTADATAVLKSLTDERYNGEIPSTTFASLSDEIYYNWRIEMWGEGRALQVFKRYQATVQRGSNHFAFEGQEFNGTDLQFIFQIPYSETTTNPELEI